MNDSLTHVEGFRSVPRQLSPHTAQRVGEALDLYNRATTSPLLRARADLQEALSTSDFQYYFGIGLDRELLSQYEALPSVWSQYARRSVLPDFKPKKFVDLIGGRGILEEVGELAEYPATAVSDAEYQFSVKKYGKRIGISWEMIVNDDLDALTDLPARLAQAAVETEDRMATSLYATAAGPNTDFFKAGNGNAPTALPLTRENLQTAIQVITSRKDSDGRPIAFPQFALIVPPALALSADQIVNAIEVELTSGNVKTKVRNTIGSQVTVVVDPWLPVVDVSNKAATTWYLVPVPSVSRPALVMGFLRGHETPDIRVKADTGTRVGGGSLSPEDGSFDFDDVQYRARHVLGGTVLDPIGTYVSLGS